MISLHLLFTYLFIISNLAKLNQASCDINGKCDDNVHDYKYDKESNIIFQNIEITQNSYKPCNQTKCTCNLKTLKADLKPFRSGIPREALENVRDRGTKYQVIGHKLYRQRDCMFPARCSGIEYFIKKIVNELSDMEMIINCRDWPQINQQWNDKMGPVFSFSKTNEYMDIMYPTWGFWEGGPAISLYPKGIGRWDLHRTSIKRAAEEYPWDKKETKAFFRGSRTSSERDSIVLLSRKNNILVDAQYTKNQAWKSDADTLGAHPANEVKFEDHCRYKYLFNFRGVAASFRLKHLFLCKSLVFHVGDEWKEFFYDSLVPWFHYIPLASNPTVEEIEKILIFFKNNEDIAKNIAEQGYKHIWQHLRIKDVECYWRTLLIKYSKLLNYTVTLDQTLIEV